jgi:DNA repair exonuclease SbcCD ATPase subunit
MRDLNVLKERIDYAERHLKASHSARERESEALMEMWRQIRNRFEAQEKEIARYRAEVAEMGRVNDELSSLVDRLIATIEGSVDESQSEAVPTIAGLAGDLLGSEPDDSLPPQAAEPEIPPLRPETKLETETETETEAEAVSTSDLDLPPPPAPSEAETSFAAALEEELTLSAEDEIFESAPTMPVTEASASEGIRDLVSRIESSVGGSASDEEASPSDDGLEEDDDLAKELEDIEALRNELNGLRDKISAGA